MLPFWNSHEEFRKFIKMQFMKCESCKMRVQVMSRVTMVVVSVSNVKSYSGGGECK